MNNSTARLRTLKQVLPFAERDGYAVGSFSPRTTAMIQPVLCSGQAARSPLIVQISQKELNRYQIAPLLLRRNFSRSWNENISACRLLCTSTIQKIFL